MKLIKPEHPYIDENGNEHYDQVRHYSKNGYKVLQFETGVKYDDAVDNYPCRYTYYETDEPIEKEVEQNDNNT